MTGLVDVVSGVSIIETPIWPGPGKPLPLNPDHIVATPLSTERFEQLQSPLYRIVSTYACVMPPQGLERALAASQTFRKYPCCIWFLYFSHKARSSQLVLEEISLLRSLTGTHRQVYVTALPKLQTLEPSS